MLTFLSLRCFAFHLFILAEILFPNKKLKDLGSFTRREASLIVSYFYQTFWFPWGRVVHEKALIT